DGRDAKGGVAGRQVGVLEAAGKAHRLKARVEDVNRTGVEVGGEQKSAGLIEALSEPLVHRARRRVVHGNHGMSGVDAAVPAGDSAVLGGEQLSTRGRGATSRDDKPARAVGGHTGGR